jgi:hypothetical protein
MKVFFLGRVKVKYRGFLSPLFGFEPPPEVKQGETRKP